MEDTGHYRKLSNADTHIYQVDRARQSPLDEKKERPSSPQEIVQYPLTISVTVFNTKDDREVPVYCEVDSAFASRVYYKMKDIYEKQNGRIK